MPSDRRPGLYRGSRRTAPRALTFHILEGSDFVDGRNARIVTGFAGPRNAMLASRAIGGVARQRGRRLRRRRQRRPGLPTRTPDPGAKPGVIAVTATDSRTGFSSSPITGAYRLGSARGGYPGARPRRWGADRLRHSPSPLPDVKPGHRRSRSNVMGACAGRPRRAPSMRRQHGAAPDAKPATNMARGSWTPMAWCRGSPAPISRLPPNPLGPCLAEKEAASPARHSSRKRDAPGRSSCVMPASPTS